MAEGFLSRRQFVAGSAALAMAGINIRMISTSEIKISVLINEEDSEKAVRAIHEEFFGE